MVAFWNGFGENGLDGVLLIRPSTRPPGVVVRIFDLSGKGGAVGDDASKLDRDAEVAVVVDKSTGIASLYELPLLPVVPVKSCPSRDFTLSPND